MLIVTTISQVLFYSCFVRAGLFQFGKSKEIQISYSILSYPLTKHNTSSPPAHMDYVKSRNKVSSNTNKIITLFVLSINLNPNVGQVNLTKLK